MGVIDLNSVKDSVIEVTKTYNLFSRHQLRMFVVDLEQFPQRRRQFRLKADVLAGAHSISGGSGSGRQLLQALIPNSDANEFG